MTGEEGELDRTLGKYRITRKLGAGAYGTVVEAIDTELGRTVALKFLTPSLMRDPDFVRRYVQEEARNLAQLRHPSIVQILDVSRGEGATFLVLEYVDGETLDRWARNRTPSVPELLRVVEQIADALDYAHGRGVVHRDVKPSNILVDKDGNPYLTDFGLAHAAMTRIGSTSTSIALGTAAYMSPEQAEGLECDARSDVYSLGIVVYELVTGHTPFKESSILGYIRAHADRLPPPPVEFNRGISQDVQDVILQALQKSPEQRFQSAGEFARALINATQVPYRRATVKAPLVSEDVDLQTPVSTTPVREPERQKQTKTGRWLRTAAAFGLGAVCVALLLLGIRFADLWGEGKPVVTAQPTLSTSARGALSVSPNALPESSNASPTPTWTHLPTPVEGVTPQPTSPPENIATAPPRALEPTVEQAPLPLFTPTLSSTSTILFQDDFSDPLSGWEVDTADRIRYKNGELVLKDEGSYFSEGLWSGTSLTFDDFVLSVLGRWSGGAEGGRYGMSFRYLDENNYYGFYIDNNGFFEITKMTAGRESVLHQGYANTISPEGDPNLFQVEANGPELHFHLNGQVLGSVQDTDHVRGDIRLGVIKPKDAGFFEASFDDIVVTKHPSATLPAGPADVKVPLDPEQMEVLLDEDFNGEPAGWDSREAVFENGELVQNIEGTWSEEAWAAPAGTFDNFVLETGTRWCGGAVGGYYGVRFRYESGGDFYAYYIYNNGRYSIGKMANRAWSVLLEGFADAIDRTGGVNRLHVEANGHELGFFVNGQFLGSVRDVEHDVGMVILRARKPDNTQGFQACFDDLIIARYP
ncbi:MAG: protein kinase [Anaerolineae bacterium]|nr:protein kinase [Anaerolineae bacterium]